ncbi:DapH/DapD/GlmU-related protein [Streptococcus azizii]
MSRAEQSRAAQSRAEQSRAEQSRAEQSRAEQSRAEQSRAEQSGIKCLGDYYHFQLSPSGRLEIGQNVQVRSFVSLEVNNGAYLSMGDNTYINDHSTIRCFQEIVIGDNTMIGDGVRIYDFDHTFSNYHIGRLSSTKAPVHIGKNSWIGANCVITKGVTIGSNVIIGAGTVVTKDIPDNTVVYSGGGLVMKTRHQAQHHAFILTASDRIEHLGYLLEAMPQVDFHIAAGSLMSPYLLSFNRYPNCQLYPLVYQDYSLEKLLEQMDVYLDINHGGQVDGILEKVTQLDKPILAFDSTAHAGNHKVSLIDVDTPEDMVNMITAIIERKK